MGWKGRAFYSEYPIVSYFRGRLGMSQRPRLALSIPMCHIHNLRSNQIRCSADLARAADRRSLS